MDHQRLTQLLKDLQAGKLDVPRAAARLRSLPFEELGFASLDHHRSIRQGFPEVILCEGKTKAQVVAIARSLLKKGGPLLATRAEPEIAKALVRLDRRAVYSELARTVVIQPRKPVGKGDILIVTAGTADIPVAEEARITAEVMGSLVEVLYDVGVAGIHRLLSRTHRL
nr:1-(5-phosphoribosyl)-5-amino-4-imidazole-carboxylate carboxylase [Nitrospirota bacterium]